VPAVFGSIEDAEKLFKAVKASGRQYMMFETSFFHEDLYAIQDNISKVRGNHLFKAGAYYSTNKKIEYNNGGNDRPAISQEVSGNQAGHPIQLPFAATAKREM